MQVTLVSTIIGQCKNNIVIGDKAQGSSCKQAAVVIGSCASSTDSGGTVIGYKCHGATESTAIGRTASANSNSIAIGKSVAAGRNAILIGQDAAGLGCVDDNMVIQAGSCIGGISNNCVASGDILLRVKYHDCNMDTSPENRLQIKNNAVVFIVGGCRACVSRAAFMNLLRSAQAPTS